MAKVELKKPVVEEISELLNGAATAVVVDYRGLTVAEDTELRKQLREAGVVYKVYKNTMINFAIKDTEFADLAQHLEGPTAIAVCKDDATAAARVLAKFAKKHDKLVLKSGIVEGKVVGVDTIKELASLPNREGMLSMLLSCLQSPVRSFACAVKAVADSKEENGEAAAPAAEASEEAAA